LVLVLETAAGLLLQLVDSTRGLGFGEVLVEVDVCFLAQRLEVRALGTGHRLVAGDPVARVLLHVAGVGSGLGAFVGHALDAASAVPERCGCAASPAQASSTHTGAWSLALSRPRTCLSTPARRRRGCTLALSSTWSMRRPASRGQPLRR